MSSPRHASALGGGAFPLGLRCVTAKRARRRSVHGAGRAHLLTLRLVLEGGGGRPYPQCVHRANGEVQADVLVRVGLLIEGPQGAREVRLGAPQGADVLR
jgi:hypothetical protein